MSSCLMFLLLSLSYYFRKWSFLPGSTPGFDLLSRREVGLNRWIFSFIENGAVACSSAGPRLR